MKDSMVITFPVTSCSRRRTAGLVMSFADYAAAAGINFSTLKHMRRSPLHYRYARDNPPAETPAMLLGRATHTAVFEPQRFQLDYALWAGDRRGKAYEEFAEACSAQGRTILRENEYRTALAIRDSIRSTGPVAALLSKGTPETSVFWSNIETGLACKGRLDWIAGEDAILDLKTTPSIEPRVFAAHAWSMGYFHQGAMYRDGYAASSGKGVLPPFGIIAVEKDPPHACRLYWLENDSLDRAREEYVSWLRRVRECTEAGAWPGPEPVETELAAPAWALTDNEAVDFDGVEE
ncbi:MAG TPA: PD-(D/E)XK nuclease-like domain-containing protein [Candidatus Fermentibacter daniensis]|nr:PD-(D/E)XK nuclease-like domain-containing protein [Candidatus Fermentibacter daniensis]HOR07095.1 PD-(D/E)XK nuclease-like domain-containing protein [Candidatus Fermentibacter daniensis]HPK52304.1 PD-(D/E)XK nuclease-like domain-containing protein [Candidatus Fermentibacter daniensis]